MRYLLIIAILSFTQYSAMAQKDTAAVLDAVQRFEKALMSKDSATVSALLHKDVEFGHSTGWVQLKKDVIGDMMSGFLVYAKIENNATLISAGKDKAIVKEWVTVSGARDGKAFTDLKLFVMEVWLQNKKGWQLFSRQGSKL